MEVVGWCLWWPCCFSGCASGVLVLPLLVVVSSFCLWSGGGDGVSGFEVHVVVLEVCWWCFSHRVVVVVGVLLWCWCCFGSWW